MKKSRRTRSDAEEMEAYTRSEVLKRWRACPITGEISRRNLVVQRLRPMVPNDHPIGYRLNKHNVLPMEKHVAAMYADGLISFKDNGTMLISRHLDEGSRTDLGIVVEGSPAFNELQVEYVDYHRRYVFRR